MTSFSSALHTHLTRNDTSSDVICASGLRRYSRPRPGLGFGNRVPGFGFSFESGLRRVGVEGLQFWV